MDAAWSCRSLAGNRETDQKQEIRHPERSDRRLLLNFSFVFRGWRAQEPVQGRAGGVRRGVRGMDAAAKPPW
ncbi:hypothetical protein, partial [Stenotrophomonas sp.]|uniref:hypothetical protein n=1 Tax=Stenotrophomonas sp. TaxID=69392 RepID=UPI0028A9B46C